MINTPDDYVSQLPNDRREAIQKLRTVIIENLPKGFEEQISYGMIGYVVPYSIYPSGYAVKPKVPLPLINLGSQKNHISLHHMGIYANDDLLQWFQTAYPKYSNAKLDMGKGCIRFKKMDDIPYELIGKLVSKITVNQWIDTYENVIKKNEI